MKGDEKMYKRLLTAGMALALTANLLYIPVTAEGAGMFGDEYTIIKPFDRESLEETPIGDTGFSISTSGSNYNNVVIRDKSSEKEGYYPYEDGLPERGYYMFLGVGNNRGNMSAVLTLPETVEAGKYIKLTYAKPKATNDGKSERSSANNNNNISIGSETIDLKNNCEFDTWYTTTMRLYRQSILISELGAQRQFLL